MDSRFARIFIQGGNRLEACVASQRDRRSASEKRNVSSVARILKRLRSRSNAGKFDTAKNCIVQGLILATARHSELIYFSVSVHRYESICSLCHHVHFRVVRTYLRTIRSFFARNINTNQIRCVFKFYVALCACKFI